MWYSGCNDATLSKMDMQHCPFLFCNFVYFNYAINIGELKVHLKVTFDWANRDGIIFHREVVRDIDYCNTKGYAFSNIPKINEAKELHVKIFIEDKMMSFVKYQLAGAEVF